MTSDASDPNPDQIQAADRRPAHRFEWESIIRRAPLPIITKGIGYTLAQYGDTDGSSIFPGVQLLAAVCRVDEKTIRRHLLALRKGGYLSRVQEGDWRRRTALGIADVYQLTIPLDFPDRAGILDPDGRPP